MRLVQHSERRAGLRESPGSPGPDFLDRTRLAATLQACRTLRHELATPLAAAALHLEVARRAAARAGEAVPEKTRAGLATALAKLEEASSLLDALTALSEGHAGEPGIVDFGALVARAARDVLPRLDALGLRVHEAPGPGGIFVSGLSDALENAVREALLAASRRAGTGEAHLHSAGRGETAFLSFRVPLGADGTVDTLFLPNGRSGAGHGPFLARWTFEAHGGHLGASVENGFIAVSGSLPRVRP